MASGCRAASTASAFGEARLETLTWVNGATTKSMDMESTSGKMVISTKVSGVILSNTAKAQTSSAIRMYTLAIMKMVCPTAMASTNGVNQVLHTPANSAMV